MGNLEQKEMFNEQKIKEKFPVNDLSLTQLGSREDCRGMEGFKFVKKLQLHFVEWNMKIWYQESTLRDKANKTILLSKYVLKQNVINIL